MDKQKHQTILLKILKKISDDTLLQKTLGFKGGTAAYLFYDLPRFSVDLDFDLLDQEKKDEVFMRLKKLMAEFGELLEAIEKRYTLFFLLRYQKGERLVKVEVSKRKSSASFQLKHHLGIPVLVMEKKDVVTGKLSAFLTRKKFAARDLFDLWFFLSQEESINPDLLKEMTGHSPKKALREAKNKVKATKTRQLLQGIGELLEEKQKNWVKEKLKEETLFYVDLYLKNL